MSLDAEMPGAWICDKCGFVLQKNILHALDGNISADTSPLNEICPNDNILMRPYTWREANENLYNRAVELMKENTILKERLGLTDSQYASRY